MLTGTHKIQGGLLMKIVVLNGSGRRNGNTEIMADAFIRGAEEQGHTVEKINLSGKKIGGCLDCKYCFSHNGECAQKDDMQPILAAVDGADMLVFASPIYWFHVSAQLKCAIDRLYAFAGKGFTVKHAALLLDSAGEGVFTGAVASYKDTCAYLHWQDRGILTVPGMEEKGSMKNSQGEQQAYALGKSLV